MGDPEALESGRVRRLRTLATMSRFYIVALSARGAR